MNKTECLDKIIELSNERMKYNNKYFYFTVDKCWYMSEEDCIRQDYKDGKITEEDAFLELL